MSHHGVLVRPYLISQSFCPAFVRARHGAVPLLNSLFSLSEGKLLSSVEPGTGPKTSCMLDKHSTTEPHPRLHSLFLVRKHGTKLSRLSPPFSPCICDSPVPASWVPETVGLHLRVRLESTDSKNCLY